MNKKVNTVLFVLIATLFNLVAMLVIFFTLFAVLVNLVSQESALFPMLLAVIFLVSIGASFLVYTAVVKKLTTRMKMEDYLSPIFSRKRHHGKGEGK